MTRKKLNVAFITSDSARKASFRKRKKGLKKMMNELSTLCGIDACAIIYSPYESEPDVWPNKVGVQHVLARYRRMPEMEKTKKMDNQESYIKQRIGKTNEQLKKQINENREKELTEVMYHCLTGKGSIANLNLPDLLDLGGLVDQNLKEVCSRIESLEKDITGKAVAAPPPPPQATVSFMSLTTINAMTVRALEKRPMVDNPSDMDGMQMTQWFTDWSNKPTEHNVALGPGYEMTHVVNNPNPIWPNPFFHES